MNLKDLFSREGRKERSLQKSCAKATNNKIKPEDRRPALYALLEEARAVDQVHEELEQNTSKAEARAVLEIAKRRSEEAVTSLLRRFTFIYDTNIVNDEEEKNMVYEGLVQLGDRILPQIQQHLHEAPTALT